ncbi:MAG: DUF87 domain-containing protein [Nanoarchaeota archaeon]|nr:DUF87 domain-containing protein [Nanoarchaeota archaeon]
MILGRVNGKSSTNSFQFLVEDNARKYDYLQIMHPDGEFVLAQIEEIEKTPEKTIAFCNIIGYRNNGKLQGIRTPLDPNIEVLRAEDEFILTTLGLENNSNSGYLGTMDGHENIPVHIDLNKVLTKHVSVLAKSGSGKCVSPNTEILLSNGEYIKIGEITDKKLKEHKIIKDKIEYHINTNDKLKCIALDKDHKPIATKIKKFMRRKSPKWIYKISTNTGKKIIVTPEHKILTFPGEFTWKEAKSLNNNDYIILPKPKIQSANQKIDLIEIWKDSFEVRVRDPNILKILENPEILNKLSQRYGKKVKNYWIKKSCPLPIILQIDKDRNLGIKSKINTLYRKSQPLPTKIKVNEDFAKLIGYMLAEGHNNKTTIGFSNENKQIQKEYKLLSQKVFGVKANDIKRDNHFLIYNKFLALTLFKLGFTNSSYTKFIPKEIIIGNVKVIQSFLSTFINSDGHVTNNSSVIEINLASHELIDGLQKLLLRLEIVTVKNNKRIKGKLYPKITISCTKDMRKLNLNLFIEHKKERLLKGQGKKSNPNLDLVPNLQKKLEEIRNLLRISKTKTNPSFQALIYHNHNIGRKLLYEILKKYNSRLLEINKEIEKVQNIYYNLPQVNEETAWEVLIEAQRNTSTQNIASKTGFHQITINRIITKKTTLSNNIYKIASAFCNNNLKQDFKTIENLNYQDITNTSYNFCKNLNIPLNNLCKDIKVNKGYFYNSINTKSEIPYSMLLKFTNRIYKESQIIKQDIVHAKNLISQIEIAGNQDLYYDKITKVEKILSEYEYVYDLETEHHNFTANNLIIHNSYTVGVLLEEILLKKIPVVVIDPHGEYSTLKYPNPKDKENMIRFNIEPKGFLKQINEFSPDININKDAKPLKLSSKNLSSNELINLLPTKLSSSQMGLIYSALKNMGGRVDFSDLLFELQASEDNNSKWTLINIIEYLQKLKLFSEDPTLMGEIVQPGKMSIINLKGIDPEIQGIVAYKLISDLFTERKKGIIPPFFLVIEECHNFVPERSYGEAKSSAIIRQVAAEGRKFGLGLCLISQRPSRVEKNALSQTSTQIILKVTNPNDVRAIASSVEGITQNTAKDLPNIEVGTALISGIIDLPILVNIRPRMSKHGGEAVCTFTSFEDLQEDESDFLDKNEDYDHETIPVIKQKFTLEDIKLMHGENVNIKTELIPCVLLNCVRNTEEFNVLIDLVKLQVIENIEEVSGTSLLDFKLQSLNEREEKLLDIAIKLQGDFTPADLFGKSGLQFAELHDTINTLVTKGYFLKQGTEYILSDDMIFLATIHNKQFFQPIQYAKINGTQIEPKYKYDIVKEFLNKFFEVRNIKECSMVKYSI